MLNSIYLLVLLLWKIIFFILGSIFILLLILLLYHWIIDYFKKKNKKVNNLKIEKVISDILFKCNIKNNIIEWREFKKYILNLDKNELWNFFNESYEIEYLLLKYNYISHISLKILSEILLQTNFFWYLTNKDFLEIKDIFYESKNEKDFIYKLKKHKIIWKFIEKYIIKCK
jgi:hypothetical protein